MSDEVYVRVNEPDKINVEVEELRNKVTISEDQMSVVVSLIGTQGAAGGTVISGSGDPTLADGNLGDTYIDTDSPASFWGPKTSEGWGSEPFFVLTSSRRHVFTQAVASASWEISHELGGFPSVTVVDSANSVVIGDVTYIDDENITVTFSGAFAGKAYLT